MAFSTLAQLAEQSKQLTSHIGGLQLPHIERGIDQIENQSRKLASKSSKPIDGSDNKAHYFLASGGINTNVIDKTLNSINLKSTFEPIQPIHDTDTEAFLRYQHEQIIINTIDESRRETVLDFDSNFEASLNYDWERTKKRIFEELGQHQGLTGGDEAESAGTRSFGGSSSFGLSQLSSYAPGFSQTPVSMDFSKLKPYFKVLYDLCEARLQGLGFPLTNSFVDASQVAHRDQPNIKVKETWELLASVLGERELRSGRFQSQVLKERVYANAYLMSPYSSTASTNLRQHLTRGSRAFLENQFLKHVERTLKENPMEANLGGVPSLVNNLRAFVQLKYFRQGQWSLPNLEVYDGYALWGIMYYMLRSGHATEALNFAKEYEMHFSPADRQFITYLVSYLGSDDRVLPPQEQERILSDYNQRIRYSSDTVDPYKLTLYKLVGRCELNKQTTPVMNAVEDFIWFQLSVIRESKNDMNPQDKYDLADFQKLINKLGPNHFNPKGNNPLQYVQALIYSQQFERALHYLTSFRAYNLETVHMAIMLTYYGLLRIPSVHRVSDPNPFSTSVDSEGREIAHFNFTELMHYQARVIAERYPTEALVYLYQICLNTDLSERTNQEQISLCHNYIQELVLQSNDYAALLGTTKHGINSPGVIEKYLRLIKIQNSGQFVKDITIEAAKSKAKEGRVEDAIQLYSIAEAYNQVVELLNRQLAEAISNPGLQSSGLDTSTSIPAIRRLVNEYVSDPRVNQQILPKHLETCSTLMKLAEFMELYDRAKYEAAINVIEELDLIPLEADMSMISKRAEKFQALDECVARNFPEVLLKTMDSLYKLYQSLKMSPYDETGRRDHMNMLKRRARTLMMFAGSIKFRMPADTYAKLNRLDVLIVA
ncbi:hypothetical protein BGW38_009989 [Lunasporangiospora selenospora]|uniref:Nuclear pore protein n=1 Tax=Lunasporangiospora selenospora TaxID=979761 RepID=A0A9P6KFY1_9FUNG|nr:hypothetical protein BGW38_009989 [Lunasporangiospora selenospora]